MFYTSKFLAVEIFFFDYSFKLLNKDKKIFLRVLNVSLSFYFISLYFISYTLIHGRLFLFNSDVSDFLKIVHSYPE